eukprot:m.42942 g.42942  ORF g.42942 m.42942 type:complete len:317 (-) comp15042_c0_seq1:318-1268(-)
MMSLDSETLHCEPTILCDATSMDTFCNLPFDDESAFSTDVPADIASVMPNFSSWNMASPPYSGCSSDDECDSQFCLSPPPADTDATYIPGLLWDTAGETNFAASIWDTPPTSPPQEFDCDLASFDFDTPLLVDDPITPPLSATNSPRKLGKPRQSSIAKPTTKRPLETKAGKTSKASASIAASTAARIQASAKVAARALTKSYSAASPPPSSCLGGENPESKRRIHNVLERKRRNDLKQSYQALRVELPSLADNDRAPTGHILIQAVEYINELKKNDALFTQRTAALQEQIEAKRRQIANMTVAHHANIIPVGITV